FKNLLSCDGDLSSGKPTRRQNCVTLPDDFFANSCAYPGQNVSVFLQVRDQNKMSCDLIDLKNGPIETITF
ncbi:hypothetical protein, partial [Lacticaseibacillus rhamnosus]|uniref:hypothetical protein n=1 Tax=Lacticaseibacillus rhamnosus TaxID=47715 RepID=UPI003518B57A